MELYTRNYTIKKQQVCAAGAEITGHLGLGSRKLIHGLASVKATGHVEEVAALPIVVAAPGMAKAMGGEGGMIGMYYRRITERVSVALHKGNALAFLRYEAVCIKGQGKQRCRRRARGGGLPRAIGDAAALGAVGGVVGPVGA